MPLTLDQQLAILYARRDALYAELLTSSVTVGTVDSYNIDGQSVTRRTAVTINGDLAGIMAQINALDPAVVESYGY